MLPEVRSGLAGVPFEPYGHEDSTKVRRSAAARGPRLHHNYVVVMRQARRMQEGEFELNERESRPTPAATQSPPLVATPNSFTMNSGRGA